MLKKLRIKLTLINMLLVTLVLLAVLAALLLSNYRRNVASTKAALTQALTRSTRGESDLLPPEGGQEGDLLPPEGSQEGNGQEGPAATGPRDGEGSGDFDGPLPPDGNYHAPEFGGRTEGTDRFGRAENYTPTVVVTVNEDGSYTTELTLVGEISEENLSAAVKEALACSGDEGLLPAYSLRFMKSTSPEGVLRIAFADRSHELVQLRNLLVSSLLIGVPALLFLLGISLFLSSLSLRPVKKAMDQQRQFIADASHELKTPLAVILANNDILMSHPEKTVREQMNWVTATKEEGSRMKELIENLLFLAKSDADKLPMTLVKQDLSDIVMGVTLTYESVAFERGILLDTEITPGIVTEFDEAKIKQLTMILLDNACKYSPENGQVRILLVKDASYAILSVNNQGDVISKTSLSHLFDRFYQIDESRTASQSGGYGLGLSIAKTITELHHGSIEATSTKEEGTTFTVKLPLR